MEEIKEEQAEKAIEKNKELVKETVFKSADDDSVIKIDLSKPPTPKEEIKNETEETTKVAEDNTDNERVAPVDADTAPTEEQKEVQPEVETQETPVLEEVTEEEVKEQTEELAEEIIEAKETGKALPENLQKVVDFMEETGGTLEEYVSLNKDYSKEDDSDILQEYYTKTKPHLTTEEINFLLEDNYSYDEDVDDEKDIKRKKLALKEQVADAKNHLDGLKSKYYEEVKSGSKLTKEQQDAISFFDRYKNESQENEKVTQQQTKTFLNKTEQVFNDKFKGFEYEVGEKKFRFNVNNTNDVKSAQSDLNNFVGKFLDKNNNMSDAKGYHKSLFTAMNADVIANHFYEQGKADAIKDTVAKSKNINTSRQSHDSSTESGGIKFKVLGNNSSDYKFKIKNK
tara:strand:- start:2391 stop:3584 length:1194 start_codon:yes stop_codon:yes gene_type:complete